MNDIDDFSDTNIISNNNYDNYAFGSDYLNTNNSYVNNDSHDTDNKYLWFRYY